MKRALLLKMPALFLSALLFAQSVFCHAAEANYWDTRRSSRSFQSASVPSHVPALPPLSSPFVPSFPIGKSSSLAAALSPLSPYVSARGAADSPQRESFLLHFQDVHQNAEAQRNLARALGELIRRGQVDLIALEGAFAPLDVDKFRRFPHQDTIQAMADYLLMKNAITGPVHTAMTLPGSIPPFVGVDDETLYRANAEACRTAAALRPARVARVEEIQREAERAKTQVYNPALLAFDQKVQAQARGALSFGAYVRTLAEFSRGENSTLRNFLEALRLEESLDFRRIETEREEILRALLKRLSAAEQAGLLEASVGYKNGSVGWGVFYGRLKTLCARHGVSLESHAAFENYVRYVSLTENLDAEKLLTQVGRLESIGFERLARGPQEKKLVERSRRLFLTRKLLDFALTAEEWEEYSKGKKEGFAGDISSFESFYELALRRDKAMARNLAAAMDRRGAKRVALVTGGFHGRGLLKSLKGRGMVSLTPKITAVDAGGTLKALGVFAQQKTPLEKLFSGEKLFLTPEALPTAVRDGQAGVVAGSVEGAQRGTPAARAAVASLCAAGAQVLQATRQGAEVFLRVLFSGDNGMVTAEARARGQHIVSYAEEPSAERSNKYLGFNLRLDWARTTVVFFSFLSGPHGFPLGGEFIGPILLTSAPLVARLKSQWGHVIFRLDTGRDDDRVTLIRRNQEMRRILRRLEANSDLGPVHRARLHDLADRYDAWEEKALYTTLPIQRLLNDSLVLLGEIQELENDILICRGREVILSALLNEAASYVSMRDSPSLTPRARALWEQQKTRIGNQRSALRKRLEDGEGFEALKQECEGLLKDARALHSNTLNASVHEEAIQSGLLPVQSRLSKLLDAREGRFSPDSLRQVRELLHEIQVYLDVLRQELQTNLRPEEVIERGRGLARRAWTLKNEMDSHTVDYALRLLPKEAKQALLARAQALSVKVNMVDGEPDWEAIADQLEVLIVFGADQPLETRAQARDLLNRLRGGGAYPASQFVLHPNLSSKILLLGTVSQALPWLVAFILQSWIPWASLPWLLSLWINDSGAHALAPFVQASLRTALWLAGLALGRKAVRTLLRSTGSQARPGSENLPARPSVMSAVPVVKESPLTPATEHGELLARIYQHIRNKPNITADLVAKEFKLSYPKQVDTHLVEVLVLYPDVSRTRESKVYEYASTGLVPQQPLARESPSFEEREKILRRIFDLYREGQITADICGSLLRRWSGMSKHGAGLSRDVAVLISALYQNLSGPENGQTGLKGALRAQARTLMGKVEDLLAAQESPGSGRAQAEKNLADGVGEEEIHLAVGQALRNGEGVAFDLAREAAYYFGDDLPEETMAERLWEDIEGVSPEAKARLMALLRDFSFKNKLEGGFTTLQRAIHYLSGQENGENPQVASLKERRYVVIFSETPEFLDGRVLAHAGSQQKSRRENGKPSIFLHLESLIFERLSRSLLRSGDVTGPLAWVLKHEDFHLRGNPPPHFTDENGHPYSSRREHQEAMSFWTAYREYRKNLTLGDDQSASVEPPLDKFSDIAWVLTTAQMYMISLAEVSENNLLDLVEEVEGFRQSILLKWPTPSTRPDDIEKARIDLGEEIEGAFERNSLGKQQPEAGAEEPLWQVLNAWRNMPLDYEAPGLTGLRDAVDASHMVIQEFLENKSEELRKLRDSSLNIIKGAAKIPLPLSGFWRPLWEYRAQAGGLAEQGQVANWYPHKNFIDLLEKNLEAHRPRFFLVDPGQRRVFQVIGFEDPVLGLWVARFPNGRFKKVDSSEERQADSLQVLAKDLKPGARIFLSPEEIPAHAAKLDDLLALPAEDLPRVTVAPAPGRQENGAPPRSSFRPDAYQESLALLRQFKWSEAYEASLRALQDFLSPDSADLSPQQRPTNSSQLAQHVSVLTHITRILVKLSDGRVENALAILKKAPPETQAGILRHVAEYVKDSFDDSHPGAEALYQAYLPAFLEAVERDLAAGYEDREFLSLEAKALAHSLRAELPEAMPSGSHETPANQFMVDMMRAAKAGDLPEFSRLLESPPVKGEGRNFYGIDFLTQELASRLIAAKRLEDLNRYMGFLLMAASDDAKADLAVGVLRLVSLHLKPNGIPHHGYPRDLLRHVAGALLAQGADAIQGQVERIDAFLAHDEPFYAVAAVYFQGPGAFWLNLPVRVVFFAGLVVHHLTHAGAARLLGMRVSHVWAGLLTAIRVDGAGTPVRSSVWALLAAPLANAVVGGAFLAALVGTWDAFPFMNTLLVYGVFSQWGLLFLEGAAFLREASLPAAQRRSDFWKAWFAARPFDSARDDAALILQNTRAVPLDIEEVAGVVARHVQTEAARRTAETGVSPDDLSAHLKNGGAVLLNADDVAAADAAALARIREVLTRTHAVVLTGLHLASASDVRRFLVQALGPAHADVLARAPFVPSGRSVRLADIERRFTHVLGGAKLCALISVESHWDLTNLSNAVALLRLLPGGGSLDITDMVGDALETFRTTEGHA